MSASYFLDTNILVYSFDDTAPAKKVKATSLIERALLFDQGLISSQVVQEFINFALKVKTGAMSLEQVRTYFIKVLRPLCKVYVSAALYQHALSIRERTKFSWYDCLIIASAIEAEAEILYSEDLQSARKIEGLTIESPF